MKKKINNYAKWFLQNDIEGIKRILAKDPTCPYWNNVLIRRKHDLKALELYLEETTNEKIK